MYGLTYITGIVNIAKYSHYESETNALNIIKY